MQLKSLAQRRDAGVSIMVGTHSPGACCDPGQAAAALILIMVIMLRSEPQNPSSGGLTQHLGHGTCCDPSWPFSMVPFMTPLRESDCITTVESFLLLDFSSGILESSSSNQTKLMHCPSAGRKLRVDPLTMSTEFSWGWGPRGWESPWRCYGSLYEVVSTCKRESKSEGLNPRTAGQTGKHMNIPQWSWRSHDHITTACSSEAMKSTQPSGKLGFKPCLCPHLLCELSALHIRQG